MSSVKKVFSVFICLVIGIGIFVFPVSAATDKPVTYTEYGYVRGSYYQGGECYYGIPYAKATEGRLRFMPPQEPEYHDDIYDAAAKPKDPLQSGYSRMKQSEDSLKLNIWVPKNETSEPMAVMFWIYGGSYELGGINKFYYDMEAFANETGCIIVSANYRLNACGFLDLRDVVEGASVNNGLRDIVFALKWVNENIGYFGGDSENVTVFGQSAGASLALALLAIDEAQDYFSKVISQSACLDAFYSPSQAKEVVSEWLELMGNPTSEELITMSPARLVSKVGTLNVNRFMKEGINCIYNPVIDGEFLDCHPSQIESTDKKVIIGTNKDEAALFLFFVVPPLTYVPFAHNVAMPGYSEELKDSVTAGLDFPSTDSLITLTTERMYRYPLSVFADSLSSKTQVYTYRYDYEPAIVRSLGIGAFHCTEIPMLFDLGVKIGSYKLRLFGTDTDMAVGSRMRAYWGDFAKYGDPGESWTPYSSARETLIIDETDTLENDPYGGRMTLYSSYVSPWNK